MLVFAKLEKAKTDESKNLFYEFVEFYLTSAREEI